MRRVGIIGGGAAGFFVALLLKEKDPNIDVTILEKTNKTLTKLRVSGGGRCNVTHFTNDIKWLSKQYPRGGKFLYPLFKNFGPNEMIHWLDKHGVKIKVEEDNRVFPLSNSSESIAGLFEYLAVKNQIKLIKNTPVLKVIPQNEKVICKLNDDNESIFETLIIASGGFNKLETQNFISEIIKHPLFTCPSLFSFNIDDPQLHNLKGLSVDNGIVKFVGIKEIYVGPILITHWGISGPAVLKGSAWQAFVLQEKNYQCEILVNWLGLNSEEGFLNELNNLAKVHFNKQITNAKFNQIPQRLWDFILLKSDVQPTKKFGELKKGELNKIMENCIRMPFHINSKTTNKDEFVTAGGFQLNEISNKDCSFTNFPNIYCIGEAMDIDGITGGFNFQAAWSTAYAASTGILNKFNSQSL